MDGPAPVFQFNNPLDRAMLNAPVHGDVNVHLAAPRYRLSSMDERRSAADVDWRRQPSRLLNAEFGIVPFYGRGDELRRLSRWRDRTPATPSLFLLHAAGGHGKTRLATKFAADAARAGWTCLRAQLDHTDDPQPSATDATGGRQLIVVDYADRWPFETLAALCRSTTTQPGTTRILMVARSNHFWWPLLGALGDLGVGSDEMPLDPLVDEHDRGRLFTDACAAFAPKLEHPARSLPPAPRGLDQRAYESVLAIHMRALATLLAATDDEAAPTEVDQVAAFLLQREMVGWRRLRQAGAQGSIDYQTGDREMGQLVFVAILSGPVADYSNARMLLGSVHMGDDAKAAQLLNDHQLCYPGPDGSVYLEPLYPDRLAEDFLALLTPGHAVTGFRSNGWASTAPSQLLKRDPSDAIPGHTGQALTFLASAAARWPHLVPGIDKVLRRDPGLAVAGRNIVLEVIADLSALEDDLLERIAEHFPEEDPNLDVGMHALVERVTTSRLDTKPVPAERFELHKRRGDRRLRVGQAKQALNDFDIAADGFRRLSKLPSSSRYGLVLVETLYRQSEALIKLERFEFGLRTLTEAHDVLGRSPEDPAVHDWLVRVLASKAMALQELNDLAAATEAIAEARRLSATGMDGYETVSTQVSLAMTLAALQHKNGDNDGAARTLSEAVEVCESHGGPVSRRYLAFLIYNLAVMLSQNGQLEESRRQGERAAALFDELAELNPEYQEMRAGADQFRRLHDLEPSAETQPEQGSLRMRAVEKMQHAFLSWRTGDMTTALDHAEQGVRLIREFAAQNQGLPDQAVGKVVGQYGVMCSANNRIDQARAALTEAEDIFVRLNRANPEAFRYDLAEVRANQLSVIALNDGLQPALAKACALEPELRSLMEVNAEAGELLRLVLTVKENLLNNLGRSIEAHEVAREAAAIPGQPDGTVATYATMLRKEVDPRDLRLPATSMPSPRNRNRFTRTCRPRRAQSPREPHRNLVYTERVDRGGAHARCCAR